MDASNFCVQLDLAASGLIRTIEDQLLQTEMEGKSIKAELYKLNVYGDSLRDVSTVSHCLTLPSHLDKGSFFKPHKDTPRGTDMLGSLVVIYPTTHEGGELVLRHKGREWKFDAKSLTASQSSPSLAYVAFYSDIEHEVLKVTGGCRVTVTYNLYLVDPASRLEALTVIPNTQSASNLQDKLRGSLKSPEFLPDGGTLGFGLAHLYPVTFETKLWEMTRYLKGEDAHVYRACRELQLQPRPSLQVIYDDDLSGSRCGIMIDKIVRDPSYDYTEECYSSGLVTEMGGVSVNKTEDAPLDHTHWAEVGYEDSEPEFITLPVQWAESAIRCQHGVRERSFRRVYLL